MANVNLDGKHLTDQDEQVIFQKVNQRWHTDSSYRFIPSYASLLYGIEVLPDEANGGETEFVNMFKVYEGLDEKLKAKLEYLHMVHYYEFGRRMFPNLPPVSEFEKENPKHQILMKTLDFIAKKEGPSKVKLASQDLKRIWKMKQTKLSSRYTTELNETISIKG